MVVVWCWISYGAARSFESRRRRWRAARLFESRRRGGLRDASNCAGSGGLRGFKLRGFKLRRGRRAAQLFEVVIRCWISGLNQCWGYLCHEEVFDGMAFLGDHSQFGLLALAHSSQRSGVMRDDNGCEDLQRCSHNMVGSSPHWVQTKLEWFKLIIVG